MKFLTLCSFVLCASLPAGAATGSSPKSADEPPHKEQKSTPEQKPAANNTKPADAPATNAAPAQPALAPPPAVAPTKADPLDAYLSALNEQVTLSKDEQTDVKAYYQEDDAKAHAILDNAAISPIDQQRQIDDLRNARNAKIGALLKDVDRQTKFLDFEKAHRVELLELAARQSSTPAAPIPNVPQPTATTPAQADKITPGI